MALAGEISSAHCQLMNLINPRPLLRWTPLFDRIFRPGCFGPICIFDYRQQTSRRMGSGIARPFARSVRGIAGRHIHRNAGVDAAVAAFYQVEKPGFLHGPSLPRKPWYGKLCLSAKDLPFVCD